MCVNNSTIGFLPILFAVVFCTNSLANESVNELENLKRALEAPTESQQPLPKPKRTRAIVFDNEAASEVKAAPNPVPTRTEGPLNPPNASAAPTSAPSAGQIQTVSPSKPAGCSQLTATDTQNARPIPFTIQFAAGSADISPASREIISSIGTLLQSMLNGRCIVIEGHTDISGNFDSNISLSAARAGSVMNYLTTNFELPKSNITAVGKGPTELLPGVEPRSQRHRRVVFKVI
ncbi:MAG TPA: OmpA family protein [Burkholderiaceae bacterium]|nr:OmpA family protein [Burkholderiaceae bacterium]